MVRLAIWQLARTALAVWALASGIFLLSYRDLDAVAQIALPDTADLHTATTPAAQVAARQAVRHRLGLDLPLFYISRSTAPERWHWEGRHNLYHRWATGLLHGNLGTSFRTGQSVRSRLETALGFTLPLTGAAAVLAVAISFVLAQRLAARPWWHRPVRSLLVGLHTVPLFVIALVLLLLFANPEVLAWFPAYGLDQATDEAPGFFDILLTYLTHLALPTVALVFSAVPGLTLPLEAALSHELDADYARTARAKGLAEPALIRHHALRNALLPTLTQVAQLLPALVVGAVVVEVVFALPGMGRLLADAAATRDYPVLVAGVLLTGGARLLALLLADFFYYWADPRIRWQS